MTVASSNARQLDQWLGTSNFYSPKKLSGDKHALELFRQAAARIPAYQDFLDKNGINPKAVKTIYDFAQIPLTSKENYIEKYDLLSRCWDGKVFPCHMISTSSGTTGKTHFWPRSLEHEIAGAQAHQYIFQNIFSAHKINTLVVNGFAMGNWIAGTFTQSCVNLAAWKGLHLTLMTPGYALEAVIEILKQVSPYFEQTIITGHNPFLKEIVDAGQIESLPWKKIQPKFLGTGQAVTEQWRNYLIRITGATDYSHTFINLYGSADAALMGFETPISIALRRKITEEGLQKKYFQDERIPSICAFDPRLTYFEAIEGELCVTKNSGCPLIRYNTHDEGGILPQPTQKFPMVYLFGRTKFMAKIYGANIYSEHVQQALDHESVQPYITGRFIMETISDDQQNPFLVCRVELNANSQPSDELIQQIQSIFVNEIRAINSEYNFVLNQMGDKVKPKIILHSLGDEKYFPKNVVKKTA